MGSGRSIDEVTSPDSVSPPGHPASGLVTAELPGPSMEGSPFLL